MKKIGIVSYNINCNFTNYGSALQSWALHQKIRELGEYEPILVDYCPESLYGVNTLNPFEKMWDKDEESKRMCELSLPYIEKNYYKFEDFYTNRFNRTNNKYDASNFDKIVSEEGVEGFVCGSDTIFCMDEFGFDDGYYANFSCMRNKAVSYAASFGDPTLSEDNCRILNERLKNFKALGLREEHMIEYVTQHTNVPVKRVIDPTLLFGSDKYDVIASDDRYTEDKYLLYYSRRYSPSMEKFAEELAEKNGWKIVEISLRVTNKEKGHIMRYDAGVEEFLSLVKHAEYVVTNSFHGMIFAVQYRRPFVIFSREQCNNKIDELLDLLGLKDHMLVSGKEKFSDEIDYDAVHKQILKAREKSIAFLEEEMQLL